MLVALGPSGLLGPLLDELGISLVLQTAGVVVALVFVSAPFYVRAAETAFAQIDDDLLAVSRTLGASELRTAWRVGLPAARNGETSWVPERRFPSPHVHNLGVIRGVESGLTTLSPP